MTITGSSLKYCHHDIATYPEQEIFYFCKKTIKNYQRIGWFIMCYGSFCVIAREYLRRQIRTKQSCLSLSKPVFVRDCFVPRNDEDCRKSVTNRNNACLNV